MDNLYDKLQNTDQVVYTRHTRICETCTANMPCGLPHDSVVHGVKYHMPVITVNKYGTVRLSYQLCHKAGWNI